MIDIVNQKFYLGQKFPEYWLSIRGSGWALQSGANAQKIKEYALKVNKKEADRKALETYFKLRESGGPGTARILDEFIFQQGRLETRELLKALVPMMFSLDTKEIDSLMAAAKETDYWRSQK